MSTFNLSIISPRGKAFGGPADMLIAPGAEGELGILIGHAPMIALLRPGVGRVNAEGVVHHFVFGEGVIEVSKNEVVVLVDTAEKAASHETAKAMLVEQVAAGKR